jgi:hypothetical protein
MFRPKLELADIFRRHGAAWRMANAGHVNLTKRRVMTAIENCRSGHPSAPLARAGMRRVG